MRAYAFLFLVGCLSGTLAATSARAAEVEVSELLAGLNNPCGLAVQPETGLVFVSDSAAGRVVVVDPHKPGASRDVIVGFPQDTYGKGPTYKIGPLGLAFLDAKTLVVGGGELLDGQEMVRFFTLPANGQPLAFDKMTSSAGPIAAGESSLKGEGNFYGLTVRDNNVYVTCNGDDTKGWIARVVIRDGKPGDLEPFIKTKELVAVDAPVGITTDQSGKLVVSQMGEMNVPRDSLLTMYNADGTPFMKSPCGLFDVAGLSYNPGGAHLYAVDFAWMETTAGGLFELITEPGGQITPNKIVALDKPTALAFGPEGTIYITLFGSAAEGSTAPTGKLVRVTGL